MSRTPLKRPFPYPPLIISEEYFLLFSWKRTFLLALLFSVPVMIIKFTYLGLMKYHVKHVTILPGLSLENLLLFTLCTIVQVSICLYFSKVTKIMSGKKVSGSSISIYLFIFGNCGM